MRAILKYGLILSLCIFAFGTQTQAKKYKARLSVDYVNIVGSEMYLDINSKYKGEDGYEPSVLLSVNVYQQITEDSLVMLGEVVTNQEGNAKYPLNGVIANGDSIVKHVFVVKIEDNEMFKDGEKSVKFFNSAIKVSVIEDSVATIQAFFS